MYVTEAMIASMEDMQNNAQAMESHIKGMIETEARMHGMELDARRNARDMWNELSKHLATIPAEVAAAVAPEHAVADSPHAATEVPEGSRGSGEYLPDPAAQAAGMAPPTEVDDDMPAPEGTDPMPTETASSLEEAMDDDTGSNAKS